VTNSEYPFIEFLAQGNKRFRFLISFNLERYRIAKGRKLKSKVIDSIVDQLTYGGCRFVKRAKSSDQKNKVDVSDEESSECWEIMSHKESRTKVAHALRDKRECLDHEPAFSRLKSRTESLDTLSKLGSDSLYIAANAMILTVELTGRESETLIKALLCDAIDSVGENSSSACNQESESFPCPREFNHEMVIEVTNSSNENTAGRQGRSSSTLIHCANDLEETNLHYPNSPDRFQRLMVGTAATPSQIISFNLECNSQHPYNEFAVQRNPKIYADFRELDVKQYLMERLFKGLDA
jgi:hypothetical protein